MKKFSLFIAALALVFVTSQCSKEDKPLQNGEKQHIVLTANNGNDGSKVAGQFVTDELDLKWETEDVINVGGGATGTLYLVEGAESTSATFEGDIEKVSEAPITFTVGTEPNYLNQTGADSFITDNICLVGFSGYHEDGNYTVDMELPYAVLKLNLSYFGSDAKAGVDVEIKVQDEPIAKVTGVTLASTEMFVAIPADNTEKTYVFNDDVEKKWTLAPNVFYTKSGSGTGEAIVIEPAAPTTPKFTVAAGKTVEFAPGNLWYGTEDDAKPVGKAFHFEANQWSFANTWDESHVSHFFWSKMASVAYAASYEDGSAASGDVFFTNATETTANENFQVSGETKGTWRTLSKGEWEYLLNTSGSSGRNDANRFAKALVNGVKGLLVFPDGYTLPSGYTTADGGTGMAKVNKTSSADASWPAASIPETTWTLMESAGVVFLPVAGYRDDEGVKGADTGGNYWSSTPNGDGSAYRMYFNSNNVKTGSDGRKYGNAVRLVRDIK